MSAFLLDEGGTIHSSYAAALDRIAQRSRVPLADWPTPLDRIDHPKLGPMMVKRDDLSGFGPDGRSGVKARKLEGMLAEIKAQGATRLVLPLGNITNLGGDLASVAAAVGIRLKFLIVDDPPLPPECRQALFRGIAADVQLIGPSWTAAALRLGALFVSSRRDSFVTVPSPSHPAAVAGAIAGYFEMIGQAKAQYGCPPSAVYIASAAGTTVAGLALGELLMRRGGEPPVEIVAVPVVDQPVGLCASVLARWTSHHFRLGGMGRLNLTVARDRRNLRYGRFDRDLEAVCRRVAADHGLAIDPIYGGKSWRMLEDRESQSRHPRRLPLFWHCGYTRDWTVCRDPLLDD